MAVPLRLELTYRPRFDEAGPDGRLRAASLLRYAQDAAWVHSERAGFDRHWYRERGLTWLIRCLELDLVEPVEYGASITVSTELTGSRRVWARRRTEVTAADGERDLALALMDWVLLGPKGSLVRIPDEIERGFEIGERRTFTPARVELPSPPPDAQRHEFVVRRAELDPMAHVNNAAYVDYVDAALEHAGEPAAGALTALPRRYRLEYIASAEPGMTVTGALWHDGFGWDYLLTGPDGRELLRARVETDPGAWVGG